MTILQMRYFLTVCRLQNITHAAAELHLAQSTLSQAMQTIEEETGLNLFLRSGRTIRISQDGQKLAQKVTALLREIDVFEENVREMGNRHGKVSLAVPQQQASLLIPRLLSIFQKEHPEIQLDIVESYGLEAARLVREEKTDLAVVNYDGSTLPDLHYHGITSRPVKFIAWPGHPLARKGCITLEEASQFPLVLLSEEFYVTRMLLRTFAAAHIEPNSAYFSPHLSTLYSLLRTHTAPSILFEPAVASLDGLVTIPFDMPLSLTSCIITKKNRQISKDQRLLIKFIRQQLLDDWTTPSS